jgi:hypothetical protein
MTSGDGSPRSYLLAVDHMESCIDAAYRAVLNVSALRDLGLTNRSRSVIDDHKTRLKGVRDAVEHSDNRLLGQQPPSKPPFQYRQPFALYFTNTRIRIGNHPLTYKQLVSTMTMCDNTIKQILGQPPGPHPPPTTPPPSTGGFISEFFMDRLRMGITDA